MSEPELNTVCPIGDHDDEIPIHPQSAVVIIQPNEEIGMDADVSLGDETPKDIGTTARVLAFLLNNPEYRRKIVAATLAVMGAITVTTYHLDVTNPHSWVCDDDQIAPQNV